MGLRPGQVQQSPFDKAQGRLYWTHFAIPRVPHTLLAFRSPSEVRLLA
jgi:hypothetical protein